jgi:hypothetical protein
MIKGVVAAAAAAIIFFIAAQGVSAQYPPPKGNLLCVLGQTTVTAEGTILFSVTYRDSAGAPVVGKVVGFDVVSQDGRARLSSNTGVTNAAGVATVTVSINNSTGQIVVRATADELECRGIVEVLTTAVFRPPTTGDGGLVELREEFNKVPNQYVAAALAFGVLIFISFWFALRQD